MTVQEWFDAMKQFRCGVNDLENLRLRGVCPSGIHSGYDSIYAMDQLSAIRMGFVDR